MTRVEGDTHSNNSHQSANSTSALHDNTNRRRDNNDDTASTNTGKSKSTKLMARISGVRDLFGVVFLPILNIIFTAAMVGLMIYAYSTANGKPLDYTIGSMRIPTFISLITTLLKMGVMGGIGYAISEYKWVRFQNGGQLSLLDVYDACTRGVGGVIRVLLSIRMDTILIPAVIFQVGLIALGPAAQEILASYHESATCYVEPPLRPFRIKNFHRDQWYTLPRPRRIGQLKGIKQSSYVPQLGFGAAYTNYSRGFLVYTYNIDSINVTWRDMPTMRNDIDCVTGSYADTRIINDQTLNVSTLNEYFGSDRPIDVPRIFYAESMYNRTHYDRERLAYSIFDEPGYYPEDRPLLGDQTVVIVTKGGQAMSSSLNNPDEEATVEQCTLRSYVSNSTMTESGTFTAEIFPTWENKQLIEINYDDLLNGTYMDLIRANRVSDNAYAYQLSLIATMTDRNNIKFHQDSADRWAAAVQDNGNFESAFTNYIRDGLYRSDLLMTFYAPAEQIPSRIMYGDTCFSDDVTYNLDSAAYMGLSLASLVPLSWWVVLWIISLYQTNGISRGNSQIALMATGLTHRVSDRFKGFSHTGQAQLFSRASKVKAWFGEIKRNDGRRGHVAFGFQDEIQPLRVRNQRNDEEVA
ncbi:hypothetical protein K492DRAFT_199855 [Lichtheimia hyalospora FSU 10163]|nr:hypothetical protein K492DRAFT_199855 [Lichtheimia hyalospora FSU 10163]